MTKRNAPLRAEGRERPSGKTPAVSLAVKVSVAVTGTMAVMMLLFTWQGYERCRGALSDEVDSLGAALVRSLASVDADSWRSSNGTLAAAAEQVRDQSPQFAVYLQEKFGITVQPVSGSRKRASLPEGFTEQQDRFIAENESVQQRNMNRLQAVTNPLVEGSPVPTEVVDAFILSEGGGECLIRANPDGGTFVTTASERFVKAPDGSRTETQVRQGSIEEIGDVWSYSHPLRDAEGKVTHQAYAFLSTDHIRDTLAGMWTLGFFFAGVVVVAGGIACYLITRFVTAPLKTLVKDVETMKLSSLHKTHVHTDDEIGLLARTMDAMVRRIDHARLSHDQEMADDVGKTLAPDAIPYIPHFHVDVLHRLIPEIGATYYDFLDLPGNRRGFLVAQGSHGGIAAAMTVAAAGALFRSETHTVHDPKELMVRVNDRLHEHLHEDIHVGAVLAVLDPSTGQLMVCNAGSLPVVIHSAKTGEPHTVTPGGSSLGVETGSGFRDTLEIHRYQFAAGDRMVLGSRGMVSLKGAQGELLGEDQWTEIVRSAAAGDAESFQASLRVALGQFVGHAKQDHDLVALTVAVEDTVDFAVQTKVAGNAA